MSQSSQSTPGQSNTQNKYYVYIIKAQDGLVKVGYTGDPEQRIKSLQTGSPFLLSYHKLVETDTKRSAMRIEKHLLEQFRLYSVAQEGEWFSCPDYLITVVLFHGKRFAGLRDIPYSVANSLK